MSDLKDKACKPCEGKTRAYTSTVAKTMLKKLHAEWKIGADSKSIRREYRFKNFYRTMSFVNAVAHIANAEDHHPDLEVGYDYCNITFTTHAIKGLSANDFICAAKVDGVAV